MATTRKLGGYIIDDQTQLELVEDLKGEATHERSAAPKRCEKVYPTPGGMQRCIEASVATVHAGKGWRACKAHAPVPMGVAVTFDSIGDVEVNVEASIKAVDAESFKERLKSPEGKKAIQDAIKPFAKGGVVEEVPRLNMPCVVLPLPDELKEPERTPEQIREDTKDDLEEYWDDKADECEACGAESPETVIAGGSCFDCNLVAQRAKALTRIMKDIEAKSVPAPPRRKLTGWDKIHGMPGLA